MASDLQDPPTLIPQFLAKWEEGYKVALGVRATTEESWPMASIRSLYYRLLGTVADVETVPQATGFGLFDREVMDIFRAMADPYPYFRGILAEMGFPIARIPYDQPLRKRGLTKNNFYTLFDLAMLGLTTHSKVPLRLATIAGFGLSGLSLFVAFGYLVAKLLFWSQFQMGVAPLLIGIFATFSVQLFFLGLLGEYIGAVHTQLARRPLVIERERINFEEALPSRLPERRQLSNS
jgi:glycosyltransferase involved in cell wall biosynthesis